jgi:hypothetical protein
MLAVEGKERVKRENRTHHQHETRRQSHHLPPHCALNVDAHKNALIFNKGSSSRWQIYTNHEKRKKTL